MNATLGLEEGLRALVRDEVRGVVREELQLVVEDRGARNGNDAYLSIAKAAHVADVAPGTVRTWIRSGRIESRRAGRVLRVSRAELERFLAQEPTEPAQKAIRRRADQITAGRAAPLRVKHYGEQRATAREKRG